VTVISDSGPAVALISPELDGECRSPVRIIAHFTPCNGKEVDLSTLKVEWLKFITIDLTSRVLPFVTREGIFAEEVPLPPGQHKIKLSIGDTGGGATQLLIKIRII
jgi:hypothetical protein